MFKDMPFLPKQKDALKDPWFRTTVSGVFFETSKIQVLQLGRVDLDIRHWSLGRVSNARCMAFHDLNPQALHGLKVHRRLE